MSALSRRLHLPLLLVVACAGPQAAPDTAADRAAIDAGHEAFVAGMRKTDCTALLALLTPDAVVTPPNALEATGIEGVRSWCEPTFAQVKSKALAITNRDVTLSGDWGIEHGNFDWTVVPVAGGGDVRELGRFVGIWQRQSDGSWKLARDIWNSELPVPTTATTGGVDVRAQLIGTWDLNVEKSQYNPGPPPRSIVRTVEAVGAHGVRMTNKIVDADGSRRSDQWTGYYDGMDYAYTGDPTVDVQAVTARDAFNAEFTLKKAGKVTRNGTRTISKDGKVMTVTSKGTGATGQPGVFVTVFDKR